MTAPDPLALAREARALAEKATPGPWHREDDRDPCAWATLDEAKDKRLKPVADCAWDDPEQALANTAFVIGARTLVPALAEAVEALSTERDRMQANIDRLHISYGGAHAALSEAGVAAMRGEKILEIDERVGLLRARAETAEAALAQQEQDFVRVCARASVAEAALTAERERRVEPVNDEAAATALRLIREGVGQLSLEMLEALVKAYEAEREARQKAEAALCQIVAGTPQGAVKMGGGT